MLWSNQIARKVLGLGGALGFVFSLGACSANESTSTITNPVDNGSASSANSIVQNKEDYLTEINGVPVSPIDEYLGVVYGTTLSREAKTRRLEQENARTEGLKAQCMKDAGFDYWPVNWIIEWADSNAWRPTDEDWVVLHGYGITKPLAIGKNGWQGKSSDNRNGEYVATLSKAEKEAYYRALAGNEPGDINCWQKALDIVEAESPVSLPETEEFTPLMEAIESLRENAFTNPTEADRDWATCMAGNGKPEFAKPEDAQQFIIDAFDEGNSAGWENSVWLEWRKEILEQEIKLALTDLNCRVETKYFDRQQAYIFEVESQFVKDNKTALEALRSAAEQM